MNRWKTTESRVIYDNAWINVKEDQVINPKGGKGIYGTVHFKNLAIGIIPLDDDQNTWLVGQWRYPLDEYSWEIPMGGGKIGVDKLISAQRELKEETGLSAAKWTEILKIHTSNSVTDETGFIYLAEDLTMGETEFEDTEDIQVMKLPFAEAVAMCMDGRITDSLSLAAIFKTARIMGI